MKQNDLIILWYVAQNFKYFEGFLRHCVMTYSLLETLIWLKMRRSTWQRFYFLRKKEVSRHEYTNVTLISMSIMFYTLSCKL